MRYLFCALILLLSLSVGFSTASHALQREGIVAVVNDDIVSFSDVRNRMTLNLVSVRGRVPDNVKEKMERETINDLINEALQMQEAKKLGITVPQEQIQQGVDSVAKQNGFETEEFRRGLEQSGVTLSTLENQIRAQIAWSMVVRRKLRPQVNISEDEIDAAFQQREKRQGQTQYRLAEIVLKGEDESAMEDLAKQILGKLQEGAPFPMMAGQFSQTASAAKGGDLGWMSEGQLPEDYKYAVSQMKKGQITPPLRVEGGYSIVFMIDMREGEDDTQTAAHAPHAAPASETVMKKVTHQDMTVSLKQIVIPVQKDEPQAIVKAKTARAQQLSQEVHGCASMTEKSKHFTARGTGDIGEINVKKLPPQISEMVKTLPVGQLSAPIPHKDGIAVLMVCSRDVDETIEEISVPRTERDNAASQSTAGVGPATPTPSEDEVLREQIANEIGMERLTRLQDHYLKDLRAASFIDLRH